MRFTGRGAGWGWRSIAVRVNSHARPRAPERRKWWGATQTSKPGKLNLSSSYPHPPAQAEFTSTGATHTHQQHLTHSPSANRECSSIPSLLWLFAVRVGPERSKSAPTRLDSLRTALGVPTTRANQVSSSCKVYQSHLVLVLAAGLRARCCGCTPSFALLRLSIRGNSTRADIPPSTLCRWRPTFPLR